MSFYEDKILPHVINCACGMKEISKQRSKVVPLAEGKVLEIGMGSGLNLPFYNKDNVEFIWGLEPSDGMRRKAQKNIAASDIEVKWLGLPGEQIPLDDNSVDTVVLTYALCTIPGWLEALQQMHRVLKPGGKMVFSEHGQSPDESVRKWQDRLNGVWGKIAGGCNINRPIPEFIERGGFRITEMEADYIPGPKVAGYMYAGTAVCN